MAGRPIDEKIVAMKMDNSDFKQKAIETTGLFGKLKDSLNSIPGVNMNKVTQSFSDIQSAAGRIDLSSISNNLETISGRFSNLGVIATTALATISNKATEVGLNLARSIVLQPLTDGFREYENKMSSIGTMLANTEWAGSTLDDVKKTLGELNDYADNTIYSFEQMTANVGRFTAAGVTLEDSAIAIKGLGNLAAVSGSDVNQLNTVMYQMSQALAAGKLNLMDWNSLVNGGMAGKKTQDALVATARAMGQNVDLTDGFRNSIEQGWLTSEVFLETLKKFGADESMTKAATSVRTFTGMLGALKESVGSGWATTWELIFGDFEEATRRWTGVSEAIGGFFKGMDNARNSMIKSIADAGVFKGLFDIFINSGKLVLSIFKSIGTGIKNAFAGSNLGGVKSFGDMLNKLASAIKPNEKMLKNLTDIIQALVTPIALVVKIFDVLGRILLTVVLIPIKLIAGTLLILSKVVLAVAGYISRLFNAFADGVKTGKDMSETLGGLRGVFSKVGAAVGWLIKKISSFTTAIKDAWEILTKGDITNIGPWAKDSKIVDKLIRIRDAVVDFKNGIKDAWKVLTTGDVSNIGPWAEKHNIPEKMLKVRDALLGFSSGVQEAWKVLSTGDVSENGPWAQDSKIVNKLLTLRENVIDFARTVEQAWEIITTGKYAEGPLREGEKVVDNLLKIREAVLDVATGVVEAWNILAKGDYTGIGPWSEESKMVKSLFKIREAVLEFSNGVVEAWNILTKGDFTGVGPWAEDSNMVKSLFKVRDAVKSVGDYFGSISFGSFSIDPIVNGFMSLGGVFKSVFASDVVANSLSKIGDGINKVTGYLGSLNFSLEPITNGFKNFFNSIRDGFNWVKDKLSDFGQAIKDAMPESTTLVAGGFLTGLLAIVGFIAKMAWDLWEVFTGWGKIGTGVSDVLESVSGALNAFTGSVYANAILTIAIALGILAIALWGISKIDPDRVTTALYGLIGVMTAMVLGMAVLTKYNITGTGMGVALQMVALGVAVLIMASALKKLSGLNPSEISKSLYALIGIMGTLTLAVTLMSKYGGGQIGASALQMVALAVAVHILVSAINRIAKIKTGDLKKGLTTIGIILLELTLFLLLTKKTTFGPGSAVGILGIAAAIHIIVGAITKIGDIDVGVLKQGLVTIGAVLIMIGAFSQLTKGAGLLQSGVGILLLAVALNALMIPIAILGNMDTKTLVVGLAVIATALIAIAGLSAYATGMVAMGAGLILVAAGLNMLIIPIKALGSMSWDGIIKGVGGLALAILLIGGAAALLGLAAAPIITFSVAVLILGAGLALAGLGISLFGAGLVTLAALSAGAITAIVVSFGGLITGLVSLIPLAVNFIWSIIQQMASAAVTNAPILYDKFLTMVLGLLKVVHDRIPDFVTAATKIITSFLDAISENLPAIVESATNLMVTFVEALAASVEANGPRFTTAIMSLMEQVLLIVVQTGIAVIQALFGWIPGVTEATNQIGTSAEQTIRDAFDAQGAGEDKGTDFANGVDSTKGDAESAGENVGKGAEDGADMARLDPIGDAKGLDFATALGSKTGAAETSGISLANAGENGASSISLTTAGSNFGAGFVSGISGMVDKAKTAAQNLAAAAKAKIEEYLDMHSPSREMIKDGKFFGEGFVIGIANKVKAVAAVAKNMAMTAKDSINQFIDGFEIPEADNEIQFKAVINYDSFDASRFGNITPINVRPDTSLTNSLITSAKADFRQNSVKTPSESNETTNNTEQVIKQPAVIQVVTPEKRELAKWIVDDITEFQNFKLARANQF